MSYNPYRRYSSYWFKYWWNLPYDTWAFLKRVYEYAPILWDDRDWDYAHLLILLKYKLRRMRPVIENGIGAHSNLRSIEIHQAEVMIDNVFEDPDDEWSLHHDQWHQNKDLNDPCPQSEEECHKALTASAERSERNWHTLWKYMDEHCQGWWD